MLFRKEENESVIWGIWKIEESIETLLSLLNNTDFSLNLSSPKRLFEQTAVRVLLKTLINEEKIIIYSSEGKPSIEDGSYCISISHTKKYVAVILSPQHEVGIDIEYISDKVKRVQSRFISHEEYIDPEQEIIHLLLHWSAKETLYKRIGLTGIDFIEHLCIDKFTPSTSGFFYAKEMFTDESQIFKIRFLVENDFVITWTY